MVCGKKGTHAGLLRTDEDGLARGHRALVWCRPVAAHRRLWFALKGVLADGSPDELRRRTPQTRAPHLAILGACCGSRVARTKRANMPTTMDNHALDRLNADFAAAGRDAQHTGSSITLNAWLTEYLASNPQPPSLNATSPDTLSDGALVRFCGMVQDAHDPEFYDGAYDVVGADGVSRTRTTKYQGAVRDRPGEVITGRADIVWQRTPVVCVPIPSRSGWLQQRLAPPSRWASAARPVRQRPIRRRCAASARPRRRERR